MVWSPVSILLALLYLAALLLVGFLAGRKLRDSNQFLNATGALPFWVCTTACVAANCGSLDVIAMMALGAQYGMLACHFYWIGAVPALVVVAFWLLPAYARGRYPSVLDFIGERCGLKVRSVVALSMAAMMLLLAGVCLCAVAQVLTLFLGWSFLTGVLLTAALVLCYTWSGGFRATVFTELLHFAVVLAALLPVVFLMVHDFGGVRPWLAAIPPARFHAWRDLPFCAPSALMDRLGLVVGLGLVLGFGYWSTDFVQMQRALAVRRAAQVPFVPLSVAAAKMAFAFLIVLPGVVSPLVLGRVENGDWNATLPRLMLHYFSPAWVVVGVMGLAASLVSTFANNISGFSAAWVQGIYQQWIRPGASDVHYLRMSRMTNAAAVLASIGAAYAALSYHSLMEYIQMILSTFNAPLFALMALAAFVPRRAALGGLRGLLAGLAGALGHQALVWTGVLHYGSRMAANFYAAMFSFTLTAAAVLAASSLSRAATAADGSEAEARRVPMVVSGRSALVALVVLCCFVIVNILFW